MRIQRLITTAVLSALLGACAGSSEPIPSDEVPRASLVAETADAEPRCSGPRKRVAVLRFGGTGKYGAFEGWDVGEAIAAQLTTLLQKTDCFIVADRMALSEVLREQELGLAHVVTQESAAQAGRILGVQILIKGEITEFDNGAKGNGLTLGLGVADIPLGLRLGGNRQVARLGMDIRLIDATSGRILHTQSVTSDAKTYGLALGVDWDDVSIGSDHFSKTPLGQAAREAVGEAAGYIVNQMRDVDWTGQIVEARGATVFLNAGRDAGVRVGDLFTVSSVAQELVDPATGIVLGNIETPLGQVRVEAVDEKYAVAQTLGSFEPARGDLLRRQ